MKGESPSCCKQRTDGLKVSLCGSNGASLCIPAALLVRATDTGMKTKESACRPAVRLNETGTWKRSGTERGNETGKGTEAGTETGIGKKKDNEIEAERKTETRTGTERETEKEMRLSEVSSLLELFNGSYYVMSFKLL